MERLVQGEVGLGELRGLTGSMGRFGRIGKANRTCREAWEYWGRLAGSTGGLVGSRRVWQDHGGLVWSMRKAWGL